MDALNIYIIIILGLLSIFIVLYFPLSNEQSGYGEWKLISNRCIPNSDSCIYGGTRTKVYECSTNLKTGKPCLYNGKPTYNTRVETEPCNVQCFSSKWVNKGKECVDGDIVEKYVCEQNDITGPNDCGKMEEILFNDGFIKRYVIKPIGSEKNVVIDKGGCLEKTPKGNWIYLTESGNKHNQVEDVYYLSKRCNTGYNSNDHLMEGTYKLYPKCDSEYGCDQEEPPILLQPCRKYIASENKYVHIKLNGKYISLLESDIILSDNPLKLVIAPRKYISKNKFEAIIGTIPYGWIIKRNDGLSWLPASDGPGKYGFNSDDASIFVITIINDKYITIDNTFINNGNIEFYHISNIQK